MFRSISCTWIARIVMISALWVLVSPSLAAQETRAKDFGRQWVRSHPFTIMGLCQVEKTFDVQEYRDAGMNALLAWKARSGLLGPANEAGLPHFLHLYGKEGVTQEFIDRVKNLQSEYPNSIGFIINDEPSLKLMETTRDVLAWIREQYPDHLVLSNAFPIGGSVRDYAGEEKEGYGYTEYLRDYVGIIKSDVLMFDIYPFGDGVEPGVSDVYYQNLAMIREHGLKARIPYWTFIQSYQTDNRRLSSESDLRMQIFSSLTYGFTGIAYFTYDVAFDRGLLEADGEPNELYHHAAKVNAEVMNLGQALRHLTSTAVYFIPAEDGHVPPLLSEWKRGAEGNRSLRDVARVGDDDAGEGLVGFFKDDAGGRYFMLTNLHQHGAKTAEQTRRTFRLQFDPKFGSIFRLNRETGRPEPIKIEGGSLDLTLPGGTGDLFKIGDANFAGLLDPDRQQQP